MAAFDFPSNPNVNDIYTLNGVAFMWNGSVWKRYSTSTGAQGFQGAAGAAGAQGAQGTAGVLGGDGAQGAVGAQGAAGTGATGAQGAAGADGAQGAAGAAGAQGAPFDRSEYNYTASGGQTAFAAAYANASDVDVFMNGVRLTPAEYTPSGGTTITLASGATAGDIIDILTFASAGPTGAQGSQGHQGDAFNRSESNFTATSGQTSFAPSGGYTNGDDLDVFVNGVRLTPADYTATNGTNVVLDVGANTGDIVDIIYYEAAGPAGAQGSAGIAGTVTFSTGAPSNPVNGDLWYDTDDGAFAGYYDDGNTSQWIDLSGGPRGAQGADGADGAQGAAGSIPSNITAVSGTFSGNVSIGGTLTYEDVTNIDSVGVITARNGIIINNSSSAFDPHLTLFAENNNGGILIAKHASSYPDLEFRTEAGGGSLDLFKGIASEQAGNSSYYGGLKLNDNKALLMGTGGDSLVRYDPTPGVLEIKTLVNEPIALSTNDTERLRITSGGHVNIGGEYSQTDSKVTIVDVNRPIAEATLNLQSSTTSGAADTGPVLRFYGHSGSEGRYHASIKGAKENGTSGNTAGYLAFNTRPAGGAMAERLRITSAGDVKIKSFGNASNASADALQIGKTDNNYGITILSASNAQGRIDFTDTEDTNDPQGKIAYYHDSNSLQFFTNGAAASNERLRIDSSGRILVGGTSARANFNNGSASPQIQIENVLNGNKSSIAFIHNENNTGDSSSLHFAKTRGGTVGDNSALNQAGDRLGQIVFSGNDGTEFVQAATIEGLTDATPGNNDMPGRLSFSVTHDGASSPVERMRINRKGFMKMGPRITDGSHGAADLNSVRHEFTSDDNGWVMYVQHTSGAASEAEGILIRYRTTSPNGTGNSFIQGQDSNTTRFRFASNGGLYNYSGNNSNLSDEREKKNIVSLDAKWDKVKSWELKKFHYNEDADSDDLRYGVIAQQVEEHCPEVLSEWVKQEAKDAVLDGDGNVVTPAVAEITRKGVKEQQMMWMAVKALQEAQTRIETLETQLTDALARITALEG